MLISFVIPVFNTGQYLNRCVNSILNQSINDFEVIIIDDCSTDDSFDIARKFQYQDSRVSVYRNKANLLVGYSRNRGLDLAEGRYIWFVDSDDWISDNAIELWLNDLEFNRDIDVSVVGHFEFYEEKTRVTDRSPVSIDGVDDNFINFLIMTKGFHTMPFVYIFSKDFLIRNNIRFSEGVYYEDLLFVGKSIFLASDIQILMRSIYFYNKKNPRSITNVSTKKKIIDLLQAYDSLKNFLEDNDQFDTYQDFFLIRFLVFGIGRALYIYTQLQQVEKSDTELARELLNLRSFALLNSEILQLLNSFPETLDFSDEITKIWYKNNINFILQNKDSIFNELELIIT